MVAPIEEIEDALEVPFASSENLVLDDARRLTGPGLLWDHPGAALDVFYSGFEPERVASLWHAHGRRVLDAVGWTGEETIHRHFDGGINLALSAPMDQLYSAIFVGQTIWHFCAGELLGEPVGELDHMASGLRQVMAMEENPHLIAMIKAARKQGIDVLCDDDELSLGHGIGSQKWSVHDLPNPADVDWAALSDIPVALITGTNGKTTTTRLSAAIARAAGKTAGLTSTDFVRVGDDYLDYGDYSGPGGARMLLRDPRLEMAYLEVARGGILRRGLPLTEATAAVVTNVANDHLGQYGINTVPDLAIAKFAVHRTLSDTGILILNADDAYVVDEASRTDANICWISQDAANEKITAAKADGGLCAYLEDGSLTYFNGKQAEQIAHVKDVPITMNGAAGYNVMNALAAICLSRALGVSNADIRAGLAAFKNDAKSNPGRCNEFRVNGARAFVDFAHNPHSIGAVCKAMAAVPANKRYVMLSHAGDRSDQDIRDIISTAFALNPDFIVATENKKVLRGREMGEISALIADEARNQGLDDDHILFAESPSEAAEMIVDRLQEGDLGLLLVLGERDKVFEMLEQRGEPVG